MSYFDKDSCACTYFSGVKCRDHWGDRDGFPVRKPEDRKPGYESCGCPCHPSVAGFVAAWLIFSLFGCTIGMTANCGWLVLISLPGALLIWPLLYRA